MKKGVRGPASTTGAQFSSHSGFVPDRPNDKDLLGDGPNKTSDVLYIIAFIYSYHAAVLNQAIRTQICAFVGLSVPYQHRLRLPASCTCLPLAYWLCPNQLTHSKCFFVFDAFYWHVV